MVPILVVILSAWFGSWTSESNNFAGSQIKLSSKGDVPLKGNKKKVDKMLFSPNVEDRLNGLPDDIISSIMSFLTPHDSVRMIMFSRRWWNAVLPNLNLNWCVPCEIDCVDTCECRRGKYLQDAHQVLRWYKNQDLLSFRFSFCYRKDYAAAVTWWIEFAAAKKHLQRLEFDFFCQCRHAVHSRYKVDKLYFITISFFSYFSCLKHLHLNSCVLKHDGVLRLKKLVRLDLANVVLEGTQWQCFLSCFPTLEWLQLIFCNLPNRLCIGDNFRHLSFLLIRCSWNPREVVLGAKNLRTFEFIGAMDPVRFSFLSMLNLENAYICVRYLEENEAETLFRKLTCNLCTLKTLGLCGVPPLMHQVAKLQGSPWLSVSQLYLGMEGDDLGMDLGMDLPRILEAFPLVQKLYVLLPSMLKFKTSELPVVYLHLHLKDIELGHFRVEWMHCARYLLRSAVVLDRMVISRRRKYYHGAGNWYSGPFCFNEIEREFIHTTLDGHAISPDVKLIIA